MRLRNTGDGWAASGLGDTAGVGEGVLGGVYDTTTACEDGPSWFSASKSWATRVLLPVTKLRLTLKLPSGWQSVDPAKTPLRVTSMRVPCGQVPFTIMGEAVIAVLSLG